MEAAGIEPSDDFDATDSGLCDCENCRQCRAAYALHLECFKGQFLASVDTDLRRVIAGWERLTDALRNAVMTLVLTQ